MWLKKLIFGFHIVESISKPLVIYCNNTAVVHFSQNNRCATRSKHFDIKYLFVREKVREFQTRIEYTATGHMLADPLTKGLPIRVYQRHVTHMCLLSLLIFWVSGNLNLCIYLLCNCLRYVLNDMSIISSYL